MISNILAVLGGLAEIVHEFCLAGQAVDGYLDGYDRRVVRGLAQQPEEGGHALVWVGEQPVVALYLAGHALAERDAGRLLRLKGRIAQRRALFGVQARGQGVGVVQAERRAGHEYLLRRDRQPLLEIAGEVLALHLKKFPRPAPIKAQNISISPPPSKKVNPPQAIAAAIPRAIGE